MRIRHDPEAFSSTLNGRVVDRLDIDTLINTPRIIKQRNEKLTTVKPFRLCKPARMGDHFVAGAH